MPYTVQSEFNASSSVSIPAQPLHEKRFDRVGNGSTACAKLDGNNELNINVPEQVLTRHPIPAVRNQADLTHLLIRLPHRDSHLCMALPRPGLEIRELERRGVHDRRTPGNRWVVPFVLKT